MANNRKPRKAHRPRTPNIPMMAETRNNLALEMHAAVETLIHSPSVPAFNRIARAIEALDRVIHIPELMPMAQAIESIADRYTRVGKLGASESEAKDLQHGAALIDATLPAISKNSIESSIRAVNRAWQI